MKLKIKLYGTLSQRVSGYQHSQGIVVEVPDGATVKDLLTLLEISESQGAVVIMESRVLKAADKIKDGVVVNVLQAIGGG
jgi:sulfur carrier protein ThiS